MKAAFERNYARSLEGEHTMSSVNRREMLNGIREDINSFRDATQVERLLMIWCTSTKIYVEIGPAHLDMASFEAAIAANDDTIAPSMLYAYAAILEGVPFANGSPNLAVDTPVLRQL